MLKPLKEYIKSNWIKIGVLIFITCSALTRVTSELKPLAIGDGIEYVMMTEAIGNHLSMDIDTADFTSFKTSYLRTNKWKNNDRYYGFDEVYEFVKTPSKKFLDDKDGFFVAKNGKVYSYHFFFYSLLNVPARLIARAFSLNPLGIFQFMNALFIIVSCFIFYKISKFNQFITACFCLLFYYSTNYWYIGWPHPEILTICLTALGLWFFYNDKYYIGIGLIACAALQNQPLAVLLGILCLVTIFKRGFNFRNILKISAIASLVVLPSLFFYYHFSITNLVQYKGFLDTRAITFQRFFGFFFDLNQGMILAFPLILVIYLILIILKIIKFRSAMNKWDLFLFPAIMIMTCIACTMTNWNHGQAVVNRYVTYISTVVLIHFFFLLVQERNLKIAYFLLIPVVISQIIAIHYFQTFNSFDRSDVPKPISSWVLENYPEYYNPDPQIFYGRYMGMVPHFEENSPAYYIKKNGGITKFLVFRYNINNLKKFGYTQTQIDSILPFIDFVGDWGYINVNDKFRSSFTNKQTSEADIENRIDLEIVKIKASEAWYEQIKQKAKQKGKSEDDMLREDAAYVLSVTIPKSYKSTEQRIKEKIDEIKGAPGWLKLIEDKAKAQHITLDSAVRNDAVYMVGREE